MADGHLPAPESLWRVATRASLVECRLALVDGQWFELRVCQDDDVVVRERFWSVEAARAYASTLHEKVLQLSAESHQPHLRRANDSRR
jgi:hypothetical protein